MRMRNGRHGYGVVTKALHWMTVLVIAVQLTVGWTMHVESPSDRADARIDGVEAAAEEGAEAQGEVAEERLEAELERREEAAETLPDTVSIDQLLDVLSGAALGDGVSGVELHVMLGLAVAGLGLARLVWRRTTPLPPWAEHLSAGERVLESRLEKALLTLLLVVPGTGLTLVVLGDDLVALHVAAQMALLGTIGLHVGLVLKHTVVRRNRHLSRML